MIAVAIQKTVFYNPNEQKVSTKNKHYQIYEGYLLTDLNLVDQSQLLHGASIEFKMPNIITITSTYEPESEQQFVALLSFAGQFTVLTSIFYSKTVDEDQVIAQYQALIDEENIYEDLECYKLSYVTNQIHVDCFYESSPMLYNSIVIAYDIGLRDHHIIRLPGINLRSSLQETEEIQAGFKKYLFTEIVRFDDYGRVEDIEHIEDTKFNKIFGTILEGSNETIEDMKIPRQCPNFTDFVALKNDRYYVQCNEQLIDVKNDKVIESGVKTIASSENYLIINDLQIYDPNINKTLKYHVPMLPTGSGDQFLIFTNGTLQIVELINMSLYAPHKDVKVNSKLEFRLNDQLEEVKSQEIYKGPIKYSNLIIGPLPQLVDQTQDVAITLMFQNLSKDMKNIIAMQAFGNQDIIYAQVSDESKLVLGLCNIKDYACEPIFESNISIVNISTTKISLNTLKHSYFIGIAHDGKGEIIFNENVRQSKLNNIIGSYHIMVCFDKTDFIIYDNDLNPILWQTSAESDGFIIDVKVDNLIAFIIYQDFYLEFEYKYMKYMQFKGRYVHRVKDFTNVETKDSQIIFFSPDGYSIFYDKYKRGTFNINLGKFQVQKSNEYLFLYNETDLILFQASMDDSLCSLLRYHYRYQFSSEVFFINVGEYLLFYQNKGFYHIKELYYFPNVVHDDQIYFKVLQNSVKFKNLLNHEVEAKYKYMSETLDVFPIEQDFVVELLDNQGQLPQLFFGSYQTLYSHQDVKIINNFEIKQEARQFVDYLIIGQTEVFIEKHVKESLFQGNSNQQNVTKVITRYENKTQTYEVNDYCTRIFPYLEGIILTCEERIYQFLDLQELSQIEEHTQLIDVNQIKKYDSYKRDAVFLTYDKKLTVLSDLKFVKSQDNIKSFTIDEEKLIVLFQKMFKICNYQLKCSKDINITMYAKSHNYTELFQEFHLIETKARNQYYLFTSYGLNLLLEMKNNQDFTLIQQYSNSKFQTTPLLLYSFDQQLVLCSQKDNNTYYLLYNQDEEKQFISYQNLIIKENKQQCGIQLQSSLLLSVNQEIFVNKNIQLQVTNSNITELELFAAGEMQNKAKTINLIHKFSKTAEEENEELFQERLNYFIIPIAGLGMIILFFIIRHLRRLYLLSRIKKITFQEEKILEQNEKVDELKVVQQEVKEA
ncbi:hypothetical protein pb186bvf_010116 [Paramecium bursaria]